MGIYIPIGVIIMAIIPGLIANYKGRSFLKYWGLSLIVTPLVMIIVACCVENLKPRVKKQGTNTDALIVCCESEHQLKDLHVMESQHVKNYLEQTGQTDVEWCGRTLSDEDVVFWVKGANPPQFVFIKRGEDIKGNDLQTVLSAIGMTENELNRYRKKKR